ncbi:hypothetical protein NW767_000092 [Fusarium falciforme]|nr:hypothetical protein NW767_000092 [Fusarium falciforme]
MRIQIMDSSPMIPTGERLCDSGRRTEGSWVCIVTVPDTMLVPPSTIRFHDLAEEAWNSSTEHGTSNCIVVDRMSGLSPKLYAHQASVIINAEISLRTKLTKRPPGTPSG